MWKRDEAVRPASAPPQAPTPAASGSAPARQEATHALVREIVDIGKSIVIEGGLNGRGDPTNEGQVGGTNELPEQVLTIGATGRIKAQVFAKAVVVLGEVTGNVTATDKVDIRDNGSVDGDLVSPRVAIAEGAHFRGSVDMQRKGGAAQPAAKP